MVARSGGHFTVLSCKAFMASYIVKRKRAYPDTFFLTQSKRVGESALILHYATLPYKRAYPDIFFFNTAEKGWGKCSDLAFMQRCILETTPTKVYARLGKTSV